MEAYITQLKMLKKQTLCYNFRNSAKNIHYYIYI